MSSIPHITVDYDAQHDGEIAFRLVPENRGEHFLEYHAVVTNVSARTLALRTVTLLQTDCLRACGLDGGPYDIFRSGRHKNDMPGVFTTGCADERIADVSSAMSESGDKMEPGQGTRGVISDHLTLIRDGAGRTLAVEFLTGRDQLFDTTVFLDERCGFQRLVSRVHFHIELMPGESVRTETIRVALTDDAGEEVDRFAERKAALYGSRNGRRPAVFCTWYYYGLTVTYDDVLRNLDVIRRRRLPYDVFQVDEGWEVTLGEYEPNAKFPVSMAAMASRIREAGLVPGLWSSPFVAHETASVWKAHPEWILRDREGRPCLFPMNDTVYYVFDITDPGTCAYFTELYRRFTFDWGYTYHKLDFTRAAILYEQADFHDKRITLAQAYRRAVKAIREGMGEEAFFLMCGGLYDPIIGLVDAQRTGSDVLSMWSSTVNRDGKTAPYTIRQSVLRAYMNRWWANDPDALMIRKNETMERNLRLTYGLLSDDEVKTSVVNQFMGGGIMCQTEPLNGIGDERLLEIRHILPVLDTAVRPLDILSPARFPGAVDVYVKKTGAHCVCMINWSDTREEKIVLNLAELDLDAGYSYAVCNFDSGEYLLDVSPTARVEIGTLKPHAATVVKVEKLLDRPVIVSSDDHYAMGAECEELTVSQNRLRLRRKSILPVSVHYRILLPRAYRRQGERVVQVTMEPGCERVEMEVEHV